jgi:hypothetical protein
MLTIPDVQTISSPFLFLALDLPATPLFQDSNEKKIIPQVPLSSILAKFDGKTTQVSKFEIPYITVTERSGIWTHAQTASPRGAATLSHSPHQAIHQKQLCGREESNRRQLSPTRCRAL